MEGGATSRENGGYNSIICHKKALSIASRETQSAQVVKDIDELFDRRPIDRTPKTHAPILFPAGRRVRKKLKASEKNEKATVSPRLVGWWSSGTAG